jgi:hypothetical protein
MCLQISQLAYSQRIALVQCVAFSGEQIGRHSRSLSRFIAGVPLVTQFQYIGVNDSRLEVCFWTTNEDLKLPDYQT